MLRVAVVGGGIVGLCAALELARAGARTVLFEASTLGSGSTGASAGNFHFQLEHRLLREPGAEEDRSLGLLPVAEEAADRWRAIASDLPDAAILQAGGLMLAFTDADVRRLEQKCLTERAYGLPVELLDAADASWVAPGISSRTAAAAFSPLEGCVDPVRLLPLLGASAARAGATLAEHTPVTSISSRSSGVEVGTRAGKRTFDRAVVAAGPWTSAVPGLAGLAVPVRPVGLARITLEPSAVELGVLIQHVGRRISFKQLRDGRFVAGGGFPAELGGPGAAPGVRAATIRENLAAAGDVYPPVRPQPVQCVTGGVAALTEDHLPLLGTPTGLENVIVAFAEQGITHGPLLGRLAADAALGRGRTRYPEWAPDRQRAVADDRPWAS